MKKENSKQKLTGRQSGNTDNPEGYPLYPENEDIFEQFKEEEDIDPDDIHKNKSPTTNNTFRQKETDTIVNSEEIVPDDLDIPGSELDDADEEIGNEDEENNYYSLGGSKHDN